jgi:hypothetical protein
VPLLFTMGKLLSRFARVPTEQHLRDSIRRIESIEDCVRIARHSCYDREGADELCDRLVRHFRQSLPTDSELQRLSTLQQRVVGSCGEEEFAVTTLWLCALHSIIESEHKAKKASLRRSFSEGALSCERGAGRSLSF